MDGLVIYFVLVFGLSRLSCLVGRPRMSQLKGSGKALRFIFARRSR